MVLYEPGFGPVEQHPNDKWRNREALTDDELLLAAGECLDVASQLAELYPHDPIDQRLPIWLARANWYMHQIDLRQRKQWQSYNVKSGGVTVELVPAPLAPTPPVNGPMMQESGTVEQGHSLINQPDHRNRRALKSSYSQTRPIRDNPQA